MSAEYLTFTAFKIISSPSSLAGTLYSPNDNCGIGKPVDCIVRVGSAMVDVQSIFLCSGDGARKIMD